MFSRIYIWDIVFPFHQVCTEVAVMHLKYELFVVGLCALRTSGICPFAMFYICVQKVKDSWSICGGDWRIVNEALFLSITNTKMWVRELQLKPYRKCTYNLTLRCGFATTVAVEKHEVLHNVSVCLALVVQHAMRMCQIEICGLSCTTVRFHIIS